MPSARRSSSAASRASSRGLNLIKLKAQRSRRNVSHVAQHRQARENRREKGRTRETRVIRAMKIPDAVTRRDFPNLEFPRNRSCRRIFHAPVCEKAYTPRSIRFASSSDPLFARIFGSHDRRYCIVDYVRLDFGRRTRGTFRVGGLAR